MVGRTVILSDLHFGRPRGSARSADALRPLWQDAQHLVINGDTAEVHHPQHRRVAATQTLRLFDLCERDGVELTLLSGNHDPYISDIRHLELADARVFVTHGDVLHPAVAPWSPASARMRGTHAALLETLAPAERDQLETRLSVSQHACWAEWSNVEQLRAEAIHSTYLGMLTRPWALVTVLRYWRTFPRLASAFVARHAPRARFAVFGHTHHGGIWTVGGLTIINTGGFGFPGRPRAVVVEAGEIAVVPVRRRDARYELAGTACARFPLEKGSGVFSR